MTNKTGKNGYYLRSGVFDCGMAKTLANNIFKNRERGL